MICCATRSRTRTLGLCLALLLMLCGCLAPGAPATVTPGRPQPTSPATAVATAVATAAPTAMATSAATLPPTETAPVANPQREIVILHTNDEHGKLLPEASNGFLMGGALGAATKWTADGYDPRDAAAHTLLLSGGDNFVGEAISTWVEGESTVELMNAMGYRASVLGNHEFDIGQEALRQRQAQAQFPYLAANVYAGQTGQITDLAQPYLLVEVNGVILGIIGLALRTTPSVTAAKGVAGLVFDDYQPALERWVPEVRQQGAELVIALSHVCPDDLVLLAKQVEDLEIDLFFGGHCHESRVTTSGGAMVAASSAYWNDYVWTRLVYDKQQGRIVEQEQRLEEVVLVGDTLPNPPADLQRIADKWQQRVELVLGEVIGYTERGVSQHSQAMVNLLLNAWLWAYDSADVALSNTGGFRQDLGSGDITLADMVGVFPFENVLYDLEVTGAELKKVLANAEGTVVGGVTMQGKGHYVLRDGQPVADDQVYHLLTTDYMYDNAKYGLQRYDPQPYDTSIHWRQPAIDWVKAQRSTKERPLEVLLDQRVYP